MATKTKVPDIIREIWDELESVPINDNEEIEREWREFPRGTHRQEIWHWFEETFNLSIGDDLL